MKNKKEIPIYKSEFYDTAKMRTLVFARLLDPLTKADRFRLVQIAQHITERVAANFPEDE